MGVSSNIYVAPITLGFIPSEGDIIRGTVNGVEVDGRWQKDVAELYDSSDNFICQVGYYGEQIVIIVERDSAPTTDYELHLYRHVPSGIVKIPQRYVDGLEETTANANQALETATAAQNTANTAKTAADDALTKKNGGISEGVIGGSTIKAYGSDDLYATLISQ